MASLEYFLVSEAVSVDQATNRVSVFNILEELTAPAFPAVHPACAAIALWNATPADIGSDFQMMLRVTRPDGQTDSFPSNFVIRTDRHRSIIRIQGLPLARAGELRFDIELNGQHKASHSVTVRQAPQPGLPRLVEPDQSADP